MVTEFSPSTIYRIMLKVNFELQHQTTKTALTYSFCIIWHTKLLGAKVCYLAKYRF